MWILLIFAFGVNSASSQQVVMGSHEECIRHAKFYNERTRNNSPEHRDTVYYDATCVYRGR